MQGKRNISNRLNRIILPQNFTIRKIITRKRFRFEPNKNEIDFEDARTFYFTN